jgi:hypothetical protein
MPRLERALVTQFDLIDADIVAGESVCRVGAIGAPTVTNGSGKIVFDGVSYRV